MKEALSKSFHYIKKGGFWITIGIDAVFFIMAMIMAMISTVFIKAVSNFFWISIVSLFAYLVILIGIYSLAKYHVLKIITEDKIKSRFLRLYIFNILFATIVIFIVFISYMIINYFSKADYQKVYFSIFVFAVSFIAYMLLNVMQILKVLSKEIFGAFSILKKSWLLFLLVFLGELLGLAVVYGIYLLVYDLTKGTININPVFQTISLGILLFYNAFNRIIFFNSVKQS